MSEIMQLGQFLNIGFYLKPTTLVNVEIWEKRLNSNIVIQLNKATANTNYYAVLIIGDWDSSVQVKGVSYEDALQKLLQITKEGLSDSVITLLCSLNK